jgi:predicted GNAT superfamily acetyltransferase
MTPAVLRKRRSDIKITIGPFRNLSDFKSCEDIQREVWHFQDIDVASISMLRSLEQNGGILLGAYSSIGEMIGFASSMLGIDKKELIQHSYMIAVRAAYRNFDVGFKLKVALRKESLKNKIRLMTWEFDPMQPVSSYFSLGKLGAIAREYRENYVGENSSEMSRGLPTDRLFVCWHLDDDSVAKRLEIGPPHRDLRKELKHRAVINCLENISPGIAISSPVKLSCSEDTLLFEIPYNLPEIKSRNLGAALEWQAKMRQVFRNYFKKGYAATDFWVGEEEGHLRAFYYLSKKK